MISPSRFINSEQKNNTLLDLYIRHFIEDKKIRRQLSDDVWFQIKEKNTLACTLDTYFLIINDGCLVKDNELTHFLVHVQNNETLRTALLEILQYSNKTGNKDDFVKIDYPQIEAAVAPEPVEQKPSFSFTKSWVLEKTQKLRQLPSNILSGTKQPQWEEVDFTTLGYEEDEVKTLYARVEQERQTAISQLRTWFYEQKQFFKLVSENCPSLLSGLNDNALKHLIVTNPAAISLLLDKTFTVRFKKILSLEDIIDLFLAKLNAAQSKIYTMLLLEYCSKNQPDLLHKIFLLLQDIHSPQIKEKNGEEIKNRILNCGDKLVLFLEENPVFFASLVSRSEMLFEVLALAKNPIIFLTRIVKNVQTSTCVAQRLVLIIAKLLEEATPARSKEVSHFLIHHHTFLNDKKISFSDLLNAEIKEMLNSIEQYSALELDALFKILEDSETRKLLNFASDEITTLLRNPILKSLIERIIAENIDLFREHTGAPQGKDVGRRTTMKEQELFVFSRLWLESKINQSTPSFYTAGRIDPIVAYLIANSEHWQRVKLLLEKASIEQQAAFHPILLQKLAHDNNKSSHKYFSDFLTHFLLSDSYLYLMTEPYYLDLFCSIASGKQYLLHLLRLEKARDKVQSKNNHYSFQTQAGISENTTLFFTKILNNPYFAIKLASALDRSTVSVMAHFLKEEKLVPWLDCEEIVSAIANADQFMRYTMLEKVAENTPLLRKILAYTKENTLCADQLLMILNDPKIPQPLFSKLEKKHYVEIINNSAFAIINFILTTNHCASIAVSLFEVMIEFFHEIQNQQLILHFLQLPQFIAKMSHELTYDQFVKLLSSKTICESKEIVGSLLQQRDRFPYEKFIRDESTVLNVIAKNKFFAERLFQEWQLFTEARLSPEVLLRIVTEDKYRKTLDFLISDSTLYIFWVIKAKLDSLHESLQKTIKQNLNFKADVILVKSNPVNLRMLNLPFNGKVLEASELEEKRRNAEKLEIQGGVHKRYGCLDGHSAIKVEIAHLRLILNFNDNIYFKCSLQNFMNDIEKSITPHISFIPLTFLLNDDFYFAFLEMTKNDEHCNKVSSFLNSLPSDFTLLKDCFDLTNDIHQICFARIIYRLKQLSLSLLSTYADLLNKSFMADSAHRFIANAMNTAINFPNEMLKILLSEPALSLVRKCLYEEGITAHENESAGPVMLRLLLLKAAIITKQKIPVINGIIDELYLHTSRYCESAALYISSIFPVKSLDGNEHLKGYFLRQPFYVQALERKEIVSLIGNSEEFIGCALTHPHLYKKLNKTDIEHFAEIYSSKENIKGTKNILSASPITRPLLEHFNFTDKDTPAVNGKTSTTKLLNTLKANSSHETVKGPLYLNADLWINNFCENKYLRVFKDENSKEFVKTMLDSSSVSKIGFIYSLIVLITEPSIAKNLEEVIKEFTSTFGELTSAFVNTKTVKEWRSDYLKKAEVENFIKELMLKELSLIAEIRMAPPREKPRVVSTSNTMFI